MKNFIYFLTLSFVVLSHSIQAQQQPQQQEQQQDERQKITLDEYIAKNTPVKVNTAGLATGTFMVLEAVRDLRLKRGSPWAGLSTGVIGASTILGSISFMAKAAGVPKTSEDSVRKFKESKTFKVLVSELGDKRANQLVLDIYAGWSLDKIFEKYVTNEEDYKKLKAMLAKARSKQSEEATVNNDEANEIVDAEAASVSAQ